MATAEPADDETIWWGGLRWVEASCMEAKRLEDVLYELERAKLDASVRAQCNKTDGESWRESYDQYQQHDPERPIRVPTSALAMQLANELDLFIVAVRNVLRAQERLPSGLRTKMAGQEVLELLRNIHEHWDELGGRSAEKLATDHPDVTPGAIVFTNKELWVGMVPLSRIWAWLARVHDALISALESVGAKVPGDMASIVEGDDALEWPPDRRRYRLWDVPTLDMKDWSSEAPTEFEAMWAEILARRCQNLQARDNAD